MEHFPYLGIFVLIILGGFGFPIPEDTTLILCEFRIAAGEIKPVPALAAVYTVRKFSAIAKTRSKIDRTFGSAGKNSFEEFLSYIIPLH